MNVLIILVPVSLFLAICALAAFVWTIRNGQYDDPAGDAERILMDDSPQSERRGDHPSSSSEA